MRFRLTGFGCETKATLSSSTSVDVFRSRGDMVFVAEYGSSIQWKTNIDTSNDRNCFRLYCDGLSMGNTMAIYRLLGVLRVAWENSSRIFPCV